MTNTDTKTREKLSVIPKGHWRNRWFSLVWEDFSSGEIVSDYRWPSREIAEEKAAKELARDPAHFQTVCGLRYLGAKFFPDP